MLQRWHGMTVYFILFSGWCTSYCRQLMFSPTTLVQYMRTTGHALLRTLLDGSESQHITYRGAYTVHHDKAPVSCLSMLQRSSPDSPVSGFPGGSPAIGEHSIGAGSRENNTLRVGQSCPL